MTMNEVWNSKGKTLNYCGVQEGTVSSVRAMYGTDIQLMFTTGKLLNVNPERAYHLQEKV